MNLQTTNKITLDLSIPHIQNIRCVQGDKDSRNIQITLTNHRQPYPLDPQIHIVKYKIRKPDGKGIYNEAVINSDGTISICLNSQVTVVPGNAKAELQIIDALPPLTQKILSTMRFNIIIEPSVLANADIESQFESDVLDKMHFHLADKNNPHAVTKAQVGLGNADNTADMDKNVLSAIKLAAKQMINNTEFDGTSSITTDKWGKSRNLSLSGDAAGNADIDGGSDVTIDVTVKNDSHQHTSSTLPAATSTVKGVTTLTDSVTSTSATTAATPNSVKQAYDLGTAVNSQLNNEINRATNAESRIQAIIDANITNWNTAYSHVSNAALHLPSGGSSGQVLKYSTDGTAVWGDASDPDIAVTGIKGDKETTYRKGNVNITPANVGAASSEVVDGGNFNNMTTPGIYAMRNTTTNAPTSSSYHSLIVLRSDTGIYVQQIAIKEGTTDVYVRYGSTSSWGSWVKLVKAGDTVTKASQDGNGNIIANTYIKKSDWLNLVYPIGSIYMSTNSANPSTLFGGTWTAWGSGRVPVGINASETEFNTVEKTGGEKAHVLTTAEMPAHSHIVGAHAHGLNNHTHAISPLSISTTSSGTHTHDLTYETDTASGSAKHRVVPNGSGSYTGSSAGTKSAGAHTHTVAIPARNTYEASGNTASSGPFDSGIQGSGSTHNNLQPYITCYMWKRTA